MAYVGIRKAMVPVVVVATAASCSLPSDDDEAVVDPDQTFCGELEAKISEYEVPITMGDMAEIYSSVEAPEGLESEYQVLLEFYGRLADPDFVYDDEATQWVDSNTDDLGAVHTFIDERCDIELSSPTTSAPTQAP